MTESERNFQRLVYALDVLAQRGATFTQDQRDQLRRALLADDTATATDIIAVVLHSQLEEHTTEDA